jgi:hypothetical protein
MSEMTDAFEELRTTYNAVTGLTPTLSYGDESVNLLPSSFEVDPMFVGGGTADAGKQRVSFLLSEVDVLPEDEEVVTVAGYAALSGLNGTYQASNAQHVDGVVTVELGNGDA